MHEKLRQALRKTAFKDLADVGSWMEFEQKVSSMFPSTLTLLSRELDAMVGQKGLLEAAQDWDKAFFIVGAAKQRYRDNNPATRRARFAPTLLPLFDPPVEKMGLRLQSFTTTCPRPVTTEKLGQRLSSLASRVLQGQTDKGLTLSHASFTKDFAAFHAIYRGIKDPLLKNAPKKDTSGKALTPWQRKLGKATSEGGRERYLGELEQPDMSVVQLEAGNPESWIHALVHLTVYRKRMQEPQLAKVMTHVDDEGEPELGHSLTQVVISDIPTCVWIHNSKSSQNAGATRIISFVKEGAVVTGAVKDLDFRELEKLSILDLSYEELFLLLQTATTTVMDGNDARMAAHLLGLIHPDSATTPIKPISDALFDVELTCRLKVKTLGSTRDAVESSDVKVSVRTVCATVLSILFLSEPRHALPMWLSSLDALRCVANGAISFAQLLAMRWSFVRGAEEGSLDVKLVTDSTYTIGYLLASANIAKYTLSPDDPSTRQLKELIMPACEVYFKEGSLPDVSMMLEQLKTHFSDSPQASSDDDGESPFSFTREEEDNATEEVDPVWGYAAEDVWDTAPTQGKHKKYYNNVVAPLRELSLTDRSLVPQVRQLTFIAPIVKILLLRELLMDPTSLQ